MPLSDIDVPAERPTSRPARKDAPARVKPDDPARRTAPPATGPVLDADGAIDDALASRQKPIGPRLQADLWTLVGQRAEQLGIPIRLLLADALVRALEQPQDEHLANVRQTDQRERMAAAQRPSV